MSKTYLLMSLVLAGMMGLPSRLSAQQGKILVFSKTAGFHHGSIKQGIRAIQQLGDAHGVTVDTTIDATKFSEANLKQYRAVVFLSTTGDVLDDSQQKAFEHYIQSGGGYVGVHAATDCEYGWPWYRKLRELILPATRHSRKRC